MPPVRSAGPGFSPLDERLGLRPGSPLPPRLVEGIVRLGAQVSFAQVPPLLAHFTGVTVSEATVRRVTEAAGAAAVAIATAAVADLERTLPAPPAVQQLSVDGAFVPLVGGDWAEVKTLAIGTVTARGDGTVTTTDLSYVSRLADAATFGPLATSETHRRGTSTAPTVVAVADGAAWCQGFIDLHRPDAVRVLDFAHAVEHLGTVAQALFGPGTAAASEWLGTQAHALRHGQEDAVLIELNRQLPGRDGATREVLTQTHTYLATRRDQIRYQAFVDAGYPIGSGCVESANKLLVEARLKGAGMHWARNHVNPMVELRAVLANARWDETWSGIWDRLRHPSRDSAAPSSPVTDGCGTADRRPTVTPAADPGCDDTAPAAPPPPPRPMTVVNGKPTAAHPWRRSSPFRAKR